tara:strand:+ start:63691 stop:64818 length:1128 start_codon:yes stop_codon:yes gene_type:complete
MKIDKKIRLSKCYLGSDAIDFVNDALSSSYLGMGEFVYKFETKLKNYLGREVITVNSGTTALHLALESLELKSTDEIIAPSITYLSTFQAIVSAGVKPIACDIKDNGQICLESVKSLINQNTKAIIPVHYAGNSFDIEGLYYLAKENNIRVIEDAAHAFGSKYSGKLIGSFGDIVCFSFDGIKNITCGEGGCIVTDDENLKEVIKSKRSLGVKNDYKNRFKNKRTWDPKVSIKGWRAHMSNVHAAIGISQFKIMHNNFEKRKSLANYYSEKLSFLSPYLDIVEISDEHVPHIFPIILNKGERDNLREFLAEYNIETGVHYYPCHLLDLFKTSYELKKSQSFYKKTLSLPLHPSLQFTEIDYIIDKISLFIKKENL